MLNKIVGIGWVTEVLVDLNLKTRKGVLAGILRLISYYIRQNTFTHNLLWLCGETGYTRGT